MEVAELVEPDEPLKAETTLQRDGAVRASEVCIVVGSEVCCIVGYAAIVLPPQNVAVAGWPRRSGVCAPRRLRAFAGRPHSKLR